MVRIREVSTEDGLNGIESSITLHFESANDAIVLANILKDHGYSDLQKQLEVMASQMETNFVPA